MSKVEVEGWSLASWVLYWDVLVTGVTWALGNSAYSSVFSHTAGDTYRIKWEYITSLHTKCITKIQWYTYALASAKPAN